MDAHQAQSEPNTLTSGISTLKKKWILKMSLWNIVQPNTCRQIFLPNPYTAICSNGYDLRSWVLIQAVHTTDHRSVLRDEKQSRDDEKQSNTPERDGSVELGY